MSIEHVRAAFERWHAAASSGVDMITAVNGICADNCVVHLQNGQLGTRAHSEAQAVQARALYPDLALEIQHVITSEDRLLVQIGMTATPSLIFRIARGRRVFHANGAVVARVNDRAELVEMWPYLNPGAILAFPARSRPSAPPIAQSVPGVEADALAVALQWERARTGPDLLQTILASTLPECVVHATNADVGDFTLLQDQFRIVQSAFPDVAVQCEPGFVAGDRLVVQFTLDGTQRGWLGIAPPSGSRVQSTGSIVARVTANRRVQELWIYLAPGMGLIFPRTDR